MLNILRNKKVAKKIWIILAIIIVPAFAFWGTGSITRSKQEERSIGMIFGKKISLLEYKDSMEAVKNELIMRSGDKFDEIKKYINLESQAWDRLILIQEAKKRKIKADDAEVIELIKRYPFFQKKGGFDNNIYSQTLKYVFRAQPRAFEEQTRNSIMLYKLYYEVTKDIIIKDEEVKDAYQKENEQLSIDYIAGIYADFEKNITVAEEEVEDYFTQNSLSFKQPVSFNIEYLSMAEENKDALKNLLTRLDKKESLKDIAKDLKLELKETGIFKQSDPIPGIGWSSEVMNLISKAKIGDLLPPIYLDKSYYILKIKEIKEPYIPDFETIKDQVKEAVIKSKAREIAKEKMENCLKELSQTPKKGAKKLGLDKTAQKYALKPGFTDLFKYGSYIEKIGSSDKFWLAAKELEEGKMSALIEMPAGFYSIKIKSKVPVDNGKFETEKQAFTQKILLQKKEEYFANFITELRMQSRFSSREAPSAIK